MTQLKFVDFSRERPEKGKVPIALGKSAKCWRGCEIMTRVMRRDRYRGVTYKENRFSGRFTRRNECASLFILDVS